MTPEIPFKRNVVEPVQCIKTGWATIKDRYWLFVGICLVGLLISISRPDGDPHGTNDVRHQPGLFQAKAGRTD